MRLFPRKIDGAVIETSQVVSIAIAE